MARATLITNSITEDTVFSFHQQALRLQSHPTKKENAELFPSTKKVSTESFFPTKKEKAESFSQTEKLFNRRD